MSDDGNPCMTCGALFCVSFYWAEADNGAGQVPAPLTEPLTPFLRCMAGTNDRPSHCCALQEQVGASVSCAISASLLRPVESFK